MQGNLTTSTIAVGVLAILVGLVGAYAIRQGMIQAETTVEDPTPPAPRLIPLAIADLPTGRVVQFGDVALSRMSESELERRNLDISQALLVPEQIIGRRIKQPIRGGKPFNTSDFYLEGTGPDISELLKPGFRAATIKVPPERGGGVSEGMIVDVLFRSEAQEATQVFAAAPEKSIALIQGVEVLQVQTLKEDEEPDPEGRTITLAVTPEDARVLQTISGHGDITLVTRRLDELGSGRGGDEAMTLADLLGTEPLPRPTPPWMTEVYYRTSRSVNAFPYGPIPGPSANPDAPDAASSGGAETPKPEEPTPEKPGDALPALSIPGIDPEPKKQP